MRRKGSYIAAEIMREYNKKKAFERMVRAKCKEKDCTKCLYIRICSDNNEGIDEE